MIQVYPALCGRHVGHPQGQLQSIYYIGYFGAQTAQQGHILQEILMPFDDEYGLQITNENDYNFPFLCDRLNWSTVDIDTPYSSCSVCDIQINLSLSICSQCAYIRDYLESIRDN